jgi:hypothetical protein
MFFTPDDYGFGVRQQVGRLMIGPVKNSGPLATLQTGDEIVSFDGENIRYQTDLVTAFRRQPPDSSYSIVVRRDGELLQVTLHKNTPSLGFYIRRLIYVFVPACFLLMGLVVFLLKPDDKPRCSSAYGSERLVPVPCRVVHAFARVAHVDSGYILDSALVSYSTLPPLLSHLPGAIAAVAPVPAAGVVPLRTIPVNLLAAHGDLQCVVRHLARPSCCLHTRLPSGSFQPKSWASRISRAVIFSLVVTYQRASLSSRRKVRVILAGTIAGFLPVFIWFAVTLLFANTRVGMSMYSWAVPAVLTALLLVPPAYAYAILRHRVIPISLIIRRGVQYLFAKNVLRL